VSVELRVVLLEDRPDDAELIVDELTRAWFEPQWTRVDTALAFTAALATAPDLVIADYSLPGLDALAALRLAGELAPDIPVIVVSGVMDEETCVECLRHGAVDYLLKDRLTRLGPAVRHALERRRSESARREAEQAARANARLLQDVLDAAPSIIYLTDPDGRFVLVNSEFERTFGVRREAVRGRPASELELDPGSAPELAIELNRRDARCRARQTVTEAEESLGSGESERTFLSVRYPLRRPDGTVHSVAAIYTDITRQKRVEAELRAAHGWLQRQAEELARSNAELLELDTLKTQFVATVSHELRTPLTSIRGYTEILSESDSSTLSGSERRMIDVIDRNGKRLLDLIEDLLTFARVESGALVLLKEPLDVADLIVRCCATVEPLLSGRRPVPGPLPPAPAAGGALSIGSIGASIGRSAGSSTLNLVSPHLSLVTDVEPGIPPVQADPGQLERVLLNLLTNAIKFSPDGGVVSVRARHDGRTVTVTVGDTGIGIPAEEQSQLFTRFYRSSLAEQRAIRGTGLGLAISKAIVEQHDGTIDVVSAAGRGTTVTLKLPARDPGDG
jgi:PAS domain S-box-containing protein